MIALVGVGVGIAALLETLVWAMGRMIMLATKTPTTRSIGRITQSVSSPFKLFMTGPLKDYLKYDRKRKRCQEIKFWKFEGSQAQPEFPDQKWKLEP